jgi:hypothetical protein
MKTKYRIVEDGFGRFYVQAQYKGFLFRKWEFLRDWSRSIKVFNSLSEAETFARKQIEFDSKESAGLKVHKEF